MRLHQETVALCEARFGINDHRTLIARSVLAVAYLAAGRNREAIEQTRSIYDERARALGPNHSSTLATASNLATILECSGLSEEAQSLRRDTVERYRAAGQPHPALEAELVLLARNMVRQGKTDTAWPIAAEALSLSERASPAAWPRYEAMTLLAVVQAGRRQFAEAEPLAIGGYEGLAERQTQLPTLLKSLVQEAARNATSLYDAWGRYDDAAAWRNRLKLPELPSNPFVSGPESDSAP